MLGRSEPVDCLHFGVVPEEQVAASFDRYQPCSGDARRRRGGVSIRRHGFVSGADDQRGDSELLQREAVGSCVGDEAVKDRAFAAGFEREQQLAGPAITRVSSEVGR